MKKALCIIAIFAMIIGSWGMADEITLSNDGRDTNIRIIQDNLTSRVKATLQLECHIQSMTTQKITNEHGTFTRLYIRGWQHTYNTGAPELPMLCRIVELPLGGAISARVISSQAAEAAANSYGIFSPIYPNQPSLRRDQRNVPFRYNRAAYQAGYSRTPRVQVEELGMMRSARLALVKVLPVEYSPVDSKITIHNDIKIEVSVAAADVAATLKLKQKYTSAHFNKIRSKVLCPASLAVTPTPRATSYLIVGPDLFTPTMQAFVDHKTSLGYNVITHYFTTTPTVTEVQDVVKTEYANHAPVFLLIVGDVGQIPAKDCGSHYSDLYYHSILSGGDDDYLPDMLCGRFSASTVEDLQNQIDKTIEYENIDTANPPEFLARYTLVAGWDSSWAIKRGYPQIRYAAQYYFNPDKSYVANVTDGDSSNGRNIYLSAQSHENESSIVTMVNNGVGFFNYTAHGSQVDFSDPNFTISDIDNLSNKGMYPLVVGNCCLTGSLQVDTCFGEKWLRAKDKGAIGYIGGSNYTYWDEDLWFGVGLCTITPEIDAGNAPDIADTSVGMYEAGFGIFAKDQEIPVNLRVTCNATVMLAGNIAVMNSDSSRKEYYFQIYHLFGDPSLPCYWAHNKYTDYNYYYLASGFDQTTHLRQETVSGTRKPQLPSRQTVPARKVRFANVGTKMPVSHSYPRTFTSTPIPANFRPVTISGAHKLSRDGWVYVKDAQPKALQLVNIDGGDHPSAFASFDDGLFCYDSGWNWTKVSPCAPELMTRADVNGDGKEELYVFVTDTPYRGVWQSTAKTNSTWKRIININDPKYKVIAMSWADDNGDGKHELWYSVAAAPSSGAERGTYRATYNSADDSWTSKLISSLPARLLTPWTRDSSGTTIVAGLDGYGLCYYVPDREEGSWYVIGEVPKAVSQMQYTYIPQGSSEKVSAWTVVVCFDGVYSYFWHGNDWIDLSGIGYGMEKITTSCLAPGKTAEVFWSGLGQGTYRLYGLEYNENLKTLAYGYNQDCYYTAKILDGWYSIPKKTGKTK